jgi:hypothetical protein
VYILDSLKDFIINDVIEIIYDYTKEFKEEFIKIMSFAGYIPYIYHAAVDESKLYILDRKNKRISIVDKETIEIMESIYYDLSEWTDENDWSDFGKITVSDKYLLCSLRCKTIVYKKNPIMYITTFGHKYIRTLSIKTHSNDIYSINSFSQIIKYDIDNHNSDMYIHQNELNLDIGRFIHNDFEIDDNNIYVTTGNKLGVVIINKITKQCVKNFDDKLIINSDNSIDVFDSKIYCGTPIHITKVEFMGFRKNVINLVFLVHVEKSDFIFMYNNNGNCLKKFGDDSFKYIISIVAYKNDVYLIKEKEIHLWKMSEL